MSIAVEIIVDNIPKDSCHDCRFLDSANYAQVGWAYRCRIFSIMFDQKKWKFERPQKCIDSEKSPMISFGQTNEEGNL